MDLYKLTFANGKAYIGISTKGAKARFTSHRLAFRTGKNKSILYSAWKVHGEPVMEVLAQFDSLDELRAAEAAAIARLGTMKPGGYNMTPGGEANPMDVPEIAKRVGAMNRGKKARPETRALLSAMRAGRALEPHHRAAISKGQRGRVHSPETRSKIGAKAKGRRWTEEQRAAASAASTGVPHPNYPRDEETKARHSEAARKRWAKLRSQNPEVLQASIAKQAESLRKTWARRKAGSVQC